MNMLRKMLRNQVTTEKNVSEVLGPLLLETFRENVDINLRT